MLRSTHPQQTVVRAINLPNARTVRNMLTRATHALVVLYPTFSWCGPGDLGEGAAGSRPNLRSLSRIESRKLNSFTSFHD